MAGFPFLNINQENDIENKIYFYKFDYNLIYIILKVNILIKTVNFKKRREDLL